MHRFQLILIVHFAKAFKVVDLFRVSHSIFRVFLKYMTAKYKFIYYKLCSYTLYIIIITMI